MEESKPGSARYARELAAYLESTDGEHHDGRCTAVTDCEVAAAALRRVAGRWRRRAAVIASAAIVATLVAGVPDVGGDDRVGFSDIGAAARLVLPGA